MPLMSASLGIWNWLSSIESGFEVQAPWPSADVSSSTEVHRHQPQQHNHHAWHRESRRRRQNGPQDRGPRKRVRLSSNGSDQALPSPDQLPSPTASTILTFDHDQGCPPCEGVAVAVTPTPSSAMQHTPLRRGKRPAPDDDGYNQDGGDTTRSNDSDVGRSDGGGNAPLGGHAAQDDVNETPRPATKTRADRATLQHPAAAAPKLGTSESQSSAASTRSVQSSISRNSSPTKQLRYAELASTGFRVESFFADDHVFLPPSLQHLKDDLEEIDYGVGLLPRAYQETLSDAHIRPTVFFDSGPERPSLDTPPWQQAAWRRPSAGFVATTVRYAIQCELDYEGESGWNQRVHSRILNWVFCPEDEPTVADYVNCSTAQILEAFQPGNGASSKMVDYCVTIRPGRQRPRIEDVCRLRLGRSINHTSWGSLCRCPIAVSIETKRPGEEWDKAVLQMGTWTSALWRSLFQNGTPRRPRIEFLPGIIVQGHEWYFVASVRGDQTILLSKITMGSTQSVLSAFKLFCCLERIKKWVEDVYWPAFQADILNMAA